MDRIIIKLTDNLNLVAGTYKDDITDNVYVGIEDADGVYIQDLVTIYPNYRLDEQCGPDKCNGQVIVNVFGDAEDEDYTDQHLIDIRKEEEES